MFELFFITNNRLCIKIPNITGTIFRPRSNKSGWCPLTRIPSFTQSYKVQRESHMFLTFVETEGKEKYLFVCLDIEGKKNVRKIIIKNYFTTLSL